MAGTYRCPGCGEFTAHRAVTTYAYRPAGDAHPSALRRTDAYYCGHCGRTWESEQAESPVGLRFKPAGYH
jgi:DNA-directed RNA polymerase subunit RPC12/RpoP